MVKECGLCGLVLKLNQQVNGEYLIYTITEKKNGTYIADFRYFAVEVSIGPVNCTLRKCNSPMHSYLLRNLPLDSRSDAEF